MGSIISSSMDKVTKKQMEFQMEAGKLQLERQIEMQNQMRIRMQALAIARSRDMFTFVITFYSLLGIGLTSTTIKRRNGAFMAPLVPLSVVVGYFYDMAWGDKVSRVTGWAEEIMMHESGLLGSPLGMPTVEDIDIAIKERSRS